MNGTYHKNAKKELRTFQYDVVDMLVELSRDEKELVKLIEKYPAWQVGKDAILKSGYLRMCIRRKKLKQIQKKLIK